MTLLNKTVTLLEIRPRTATTFCHTRSVYQTKSLLITKAACPLESAFYVKGAQDDFELKNDHADGISFFNQVFRKHTPFSSNIEKQYIQGQPKTGGLSKIIARAGDCLVHVPRWITGCGARQWRLASIFSEVSLYIGGELIDRHDGVFCETAAIDLFAQSASKSALGPHPGASSNSFFFPLRFFFCESTMAALPLCAIKQEVEIEIRWGTVPAGANFECFSMMYYLGAVERSIVANSEEGRDMLIFQVQKAPASNDLTQDLVFNHPVRFICTITRRCFAV